LILVELFDCGRRGLLQLVQELDGEAGKVVDEIERVLDFVRNAGGQLTERGHLLGMNQIGLRRLQLAERLFGSLAGSMDFGLGPLTLGDVAINDDNPAAGHRIAPGFNNSAIGPDALETQLPLRILDAAAQLRFEVGRAELAALGKITEEIGKTWAFAEKRLRQLEQLLEIRVPGGEA